VNTIVRLTAQSTPTRRSVSELRVEIYLRVIGMRGRCCCGSYSSRHAKKLAAEGRGFLFWGSADAAGPHCQALFPLRVQRINVFGAAIGSERLSRTVELGLMVFVGFAFGVSMIGGMVVLMPTRQVAYRREF
jgi:hypothetical protein